MDQTVDPELTKAALQALKLGMAARGAGLHGALKVGDKQLRVIQGARVMPSARSYYIRPPVGEAPQSINSGTAIARDSGGRGEVFSARAGAANHRGFWDSRPEA